MTNQEKAKLFIQKVAMILNDDSNEYMYGVNPQEKANSYIAEYVKENQSDFSLFAFLESNTDFLAGVSEMHPTRVEQVVAEYRKILES